MQLIFGVCLAFVMSNALCESPKLDPESTQLKIPFDRYTTTDQYGRSITFYLSKLRKDAPSQRLPVVLLILGSGCQSLFFKVDDRISGGYQNILFQVAAGKARVVVVEKPGVKFLDAPQRPGSAIDSSKEFRAEHTLERWAEANAACLRGVWTMENIDASKTLVVGHSEGGIVAARVAAENPQITHFASLSGGGPTQLFDLIDISKYGSTTPSDNRTDIAMQNVLDQWDRIQKDPDSVDKFWLGHPYKRWASFLKSSVIEELSRTKARIYLAHGTLDDSVSVKSHDVAVAELRSKGRDLTAHSLEGADHGFRTPEMPVGSPEGMKLQFELLMQWFLK